MKFITFLITLTIATFTYAGTGHGHGHSHGNGHSHEAVKISKEKTGEIGRKQLQRLVKAEKLDSSWINAKFDASEQKMSNGKTEWLVTFTNEKGVKGKKLFIFLTLGGEFVAANFSGK